MMLPPSDMKKAPQQGLAFNTAMLRQTDKAIRSNIFALQKMTGAKCKMTELKSNYLHKLDLMGGVPIFYRVNLCYKPAPIKIKIEY